MFHHSEGGIEMAISRNVAILQAFIIIACGIGVWKFTTGDEIAPLDQGLIQVTDSNGAIHYFDESPSRVVIANTYAGSVLRMLDVNLSVVVGVSGDFQGFENSTSLLWPEFAETPIVQQSAHSEIDFEALYDVRPDVYIVFATNGMVDTSAVRLKLEPVGINVLALDFYKYDTLRDEIAVIADLFGKQDQANTLFSEFADIESLVQGRISTINESDRPKIVMEHHASLTRDPVVLTGTSQWTDLIEKAGGVNVFADLPGHTTHVDLEAIVSFNPDVLMFDGITFDIGFDRYDLAKPSCSEHMQFIETRPGFDNLQAIRDGRMIIMSGEFAGPMMIHGLPTLAKILHPELFEDVDPENYLDEYFESYHQIGKRGIFVCQAIVS
ncbi:MAG: hypothetical protein CL992_00870 [Euryarchaeota archaeon]|nr:hypothetical protein [Euryarchaeota archaeon]